jgi:uncharacterized protein YkwD
MKSTTRRSIIAGMVLGVFSGSASYAQGKETAPGQLRKTPRATPTDVGPGGASFTSTPPPTLPPTEWTATPNNTAAATSTLTRTPAPTKTPLPPTPTRSALPSPTTSYTQPDWTVAQYYDYTTERYELVDRINEERRKVGVSALTIDALVMDVAQTKANDHVARGYTGHYIPAGGCFYGTCFPYDITIFGILDAAGYRWVTGAENYWQAGAFTTEMDAVANMVFMGSPGHRAAMLDSRYTHVGIGISYDPALHGGHVIECFTLPAATSTGAVTLEASGQRGLSTLRARRG